METEEKNISTTKTVADKISYHNFAKMLEKISNSEPAKKINTLKGFFDHCRKVNQQNEKVGCLFPFVRILLIDHDRSRKAFNLKMHSLGKIFVKILGLDEKSEDAKRILQYRDPKHAGTSAGDFGKIIHSIMSSRFSNVNPSGTEGPSIAKLHDILDKIQKKSNDNVGLQKEQEKILEPFIRTLTALEGKWLAKIILKNIDIGISEPQIFKAIHPQAKEYFERSSDLEKLCLKLYDPRVELNEPKVSLFTSFRAMLCTRITQLDDHATYQKIVDAEDKERLSRRKTRTLPEPPYYLETKWDGERFQVHFSKTSQDNEEKWVYFSRRGHDYSSAFNSTLTPEFKRQIKPNIESFILDGEMMAWNKRENRFTTKGQNIDIKTILRTNPNHRPTFIAFDILYLNGEVVLDKLLNERIKILKRIFEEKPGVCIYTPVEYVEDKSRVRSALEEAIDNFDEGLIVKMPNSIYVPAERGDQWFKIKPEFFSENSVEDLDLLILGVYYSDTASGPSGGQFTHFLLGLIDNEKTVPDIYPIVKVGSGHLRHVEMARLIDELKPYLSKKAIPNVMYKGKGRPNYSVFPEDSKVVQIKASEIIPSKDFTLDYTLRFARISKIRRDKHWTEIMTVKEFHELKESSGGQLVKRADGNNFAKQRNRYIRPKKKVEFDSDEEESTSTNDSVTSRSNKPISSTLAQLSLPNTSSNIASSFKSCKELRAEKEKRRGVKRNTSTLDKDDSKDSFKNLIICVIGDQPWKVKIENEIKKLGGEIHQNPTKKTDFVVAEKYSLHVEKIMKKEIYDILISDWIEKCIEEKKLIKWTPDDFWYMTPKTKESLSSEYDKFGDPYQEKTSMQKVKKICESIIKENEKEKCTEEDMTKIKEKMREELFDDDERKNMKKYSLFEDCKIAFRKNEMGEVNIDPILKEKVIFYGGTIIEDEDDPKITHIIVNNDKGSNNTNVKNHLLAIVVKEKWLYDSLEANELLDEYDYFIPE